MPPAGSTARAELRATLARLAHEHATDPAVGELLEELRPFEDEHPFDSFEASLIRVTRREYEKQRRVPAEWRAESARAGALGYRAWLRARDERDYEVFRPHLERRLELVQEYVACHTPYDDPYDVLLDDYEPGMATADVERVFERLKAELVPLVADVGEPVDDSCLRGSFPPEGQRRFALEVLGTWGMDEEAWRLDDTVHPFATSPGAGDIRLTTRFNDDEPSGILSCLHEFGHGLYDRQLDPAFARTPLATGASAAFHESQSRLWENLVGRRLSTWRHFYPRLQEALPEQLGTVPLETFHRALNRVEPGVRRVDADEVTYSLHVVVRFDLERAMLAGDVTAVELPDAFDAKLREYLGVQPADALDGVLQDVHWSDASFGYFPTYAIGNVISLQLWERAAAELGDLDAQFERGDFGPLRSWLGERVHRWGRSFTPAELLERIVGGPLDAEPYLAYLRQKVDELRASAG